MIGWWLVAGGWWPDYCRGMLLQSPAEEDTSHQNAGAQALQTTWAHRV